jgi:hypothetical protein
MKTNKTISLLFQFCVKLNTLEKIGSLIALFLILNGFYMCNNPYDRSFGGMCILCGGMLLPICIHKIKF